MRMRVALRLFFLISMVLFHFAAFAEPKVGETAPHLLLTTLKGKEYDLGQQKGRLVVLHFWATWCSACRSEMPILDRFYRDYHEKNVEVLAMSIDRSRDLKQVSKVAQDFSFTIALLKDVTQNGFGVPNVLPLTYLVDQKGVIVKIFKASGEALTEKALADAYRTFTHP